MQRGWLGVVMHFRGCSGEPNRNHRIYHSGETEDGTWFLHWLKREFGPAPTAAVGYSLGGNMLGCLLAEEGDRCPLDAAVIVSAPFMLEACSYHMDKGFSRVYQRYLLNLLKANASRKLKAYPGSLPVDLRQLKGMRRIREFDDMITAKIHGFADARWIITGNAAPCRGSAISLSRRSSFTRKTIRLWITTLFRRRSNCPRT